MNERVVTKKSDDGNAVFYSDGTILVRNCRWSYPNILLPFDGVNDDGKKVARYSVVGLMPKNTHKAAAAAIANEIKRLIAEAKIEGISADRKFLRDGDQSGKTLYEGHYTISAGETRKPAVRSPRKDAWSESDSSKIYGGCWGHLLIRPWVQSNKYGKRVNAGLVAAQFIRDDEPFGEGTRLSDRAIDDTFDDESSGWETNPVEDDEIPL